MALRSLALLKSAPLALYLNDAAFGHGIAELLELFGLRVSKSAGAIIKNMLRKLVIAFVKLDKLVKRKLRAELDRLNYQLVCRIEAKAGAGDPTISSEEPMLFREDMREISVLSDQFSQRS